MRGEDRRELRRVVGVLLPLRAWRDGRLDGRGASAAHAQAHGRCIAVVLEVRMLLRLRLLVPVLLLLMLLVMNLDMSVTRKLAEKAEVDVPVMHMQPHVVVRHRHAELRTAIPRLSRRHADRARRVLHTRIRTCRAPTVEPMSPEDVRRGPAHRARVRDERRRWRRRVQLEVDEIF